MEGRPRVMFQQIADVHRVPVKTIVNAFDRHTGCFTEGSHFCRLNYGPNPTLTLVANL